jgi:cbb3-type cytochrome c oxidase subunit III
MYSDQILTEANTKPERRFSAWLGISLLAFIGLGYVDTVIAGEHHTYVPGEIRSGEYIFHNYCSVCHGDKGDGQSRAKDGLDPPPRNYTTPEAAIELTRERMINSVTHGRPGTAMIAWGSELSGPEIEGVVDYVRKTFMKLGNNPDSHAPLDSKLLATKGGKLYMQNCAMCHGQTGSRATTGRMQPPPRDFTTQTAARELTRKRMITSITNGRPGTALVGYGSQLSKGDIEAIADFIHAAFMSGSNTQK